MTQVATNCLSEYIRRKTTKPAFAGWKATTVRRRSASVRAGGLRHFAANLFAGALRAQPEFFTLMPLISVVIPCYNAERWIEETLSSVTAQDRNDIEVITIDDGSTDGTSEVIKRVMPEAHLIRTPNRGCSAARSLGTQEARGDFIQYLDADDLLMPSKLQAQLDTLQETHADVAYGDWQRLVANNEGHFILGEIVSQEIRNPEIDLFTSFWCPPATYLFRRSIVERVSWNESLPVIQDARFALDCALQGAKFVRCQGLMAHYRSHISNSVSTANPKFFTRDCFVNAEEVESWWKEHGGVSEARHKALLKVYESLAQVNYNHDLESFEKAVNKLNELSPRYLPEGPNYFRNLSKIVGYARAEAVRYKWWSMKQSVSKHLSNNARVGIARR